MGNDSGLMRARRARLRGESIASSIWTTSLDRSRMLPSLSASPGFSLPGGPYLSNFIVIHSWKGLNHGDHGDHGKAKALGVRGHGCSSANDTVWFCFSVVSVVQSVRY